MIKQEMTRTIQRHFSRRSACPICGKQIEEFDDVQQVSYRMGRCRLYTFFHTKCLIEFEFGVRGSLDANKEEEKAI